jgi:hypothetical protein
VSDSRLLDTRTGELQRCNTTNSSGPAVKRMQVLRAQAAQRLGGAREEEAQEPVAHPCGGCGQRRLLHGLQRPACKGGARGAGWLRMRVN